MERVKNQLPINLLQEESWLLYLQIQIRLTISIHHQRSHWTGPPFIPSIVIESSLIKLLNLAAPQATGTTCLVSAAIGWLTVTCLKLAR